MGECDALCDEAEGCIAAEYIVRSFQVLGVGGCRVGKSLGSSIDMLNSAKRSVRIWVAFRLSVVNKWELRSSSHIGW